MGEVCGKALRERFTGEIAGKLASELMRGLVEKTMGEPVGKSMEGHAEKHEGERRR